MITLFDVSTEKVVEPPPDIVLFIVLLVGAWAGLRLTVCNTTVLACQFTEIVLILRLFPVLLLMAIVKTAPDKVRLADS